MNIPCLVSDCESCTTKIRLLSPSWFGRDYKTTFNVVPSHVKSLLNALMPPLGIFPLFLHAHVVFLPWCRWLEVTSDIFLSSRWIRASIALIASVKIRDVFIYVTSRKMLRPSFRWTKNVSLLEGDQQSVLTDSVVLWHIRLCATILIEMSNHICCALLLLDGWRSFTPVAGRFFSTGIAVRVWQCSYSGFLFESLIRNYILTLTRFNWRINC